MTPRVPARRALACALALATAALATVVPVRPARAISANPAELVLHQPDGERLRVHLVGDEHENWFQDLRGFVLLQDTRGVYRYAVRDADGELVPGPDRAGSVDPAAAGLQPALRPTREARARRAALQQPREPQRTAAAITPATGLVKNLVVLAQFSDHTAALTRPVSEYTTIYNTVHGDPTLAPTGSVHDVWAENSYGTLNLQSTVQNWVPLPNTEAYYANNNQGKTPAFRDQMVTDALTALDATVNFAQYDTNNDGYVDAIDVVHSGYGSEVNSNPKRIWSQQWTLATDWVSNDKNANNVNVKVSRVHTEPALWDTTGSGIVHIGVIAHETGHFFGLPDLYDYDYDGLGVGAWCLMGDAWGLDNTQRDPPDLCAWCKVQLGYITPQVLTSPGPVSLASSETHPAAALISRGYGNGEYLLIENREPSGYDTLMTRGGLAVWHIDESIPHTPGAGFNQTQGYPGQAGWPGNGNHYGCALLQADGRYDMEKLAWQGTTHADSTDLYRSAAGIALSEATIPSTDRYQGGIANPTANEIGDVSVAGNTMTFYFRPATWVDFAWGGASSGGFANPYPSLSGALAASPDDGIVICKGGTASGFPAPARVMRYKSWGGTTTITP